DLREDVMGDTVVWDTPDGNWNILQFICRENKDSPFVNFLNYKASMKFVEVSYKAFTERFSQYIGDVVQMTYYDDLQYLAQNRRMWSPDFNDVFMKEFGFDPAPFYPALYYDIGEKTEYYTACLMKCRAKMFAEGFFKAVSDFTKKFGLLSTGHISESKNAAISNLTGDSMQFQQYAGAAGLDMIHAYMYGFNGLKLASSAAYNYEKEYVTCEIYKNYFHLDTTILYKEAMNCFARGVNFLMPNVMQWSGDTAYNHDISVRNPEYRELYPKFTDFIARCQAMLQGGTHVCDIAMLYPIESLHSKVFFYEQKERQFEFPPVLAFADYISNINSVMNYCGRDLTVLHPDVFVEHARAEKGILYLDNALNPERYRILILPAMTITSIRVLRLVRDFYDCGGKILATSKLPFKLMEDDETLYKEAAEILEYLFGVQEDAVNYVSDYEMHTNDAGGMAIYLRSSMTDLDGTEYVEADRINQTLWKFDTPVDIIFEHLPRIAHSGILALNLIAFKNYGAASGIRSGGVFNYIHKHHDGCEVYYVSNTTVKEYIGHIVISGCHEVEEWNPHTGKIRQFTERFGLVGGNAYTTIQAVIPENSSVFYVCRPKEKIPEDAKTFEDFGALRRYYDAQAGKKTQNKKPHLFGW
ncbi:MAG: glycosyl hydrolase, partial [Eubacteriales bacterium]